MMNKIIFSQRILDSLIDEGRMKLGKNTLTLLTNDHPSFELEPAYRFIRTADGAPDPHNLVGQIKYDREIKAMHAEVYLETPSCTATLLTKRSRGLSAKKRNSWTSFRIRTFSPASCWKTCCKQ